MLQELQSFRDFIDEETLKWLPGNLKVANCILLKKHEKDEDGTLKTRLYIFSETGTFIGKIESPHYIPIEQV